MRNADRIRADPYAHGYAAKLRLRLAPAIADIANLTPRSLWEPGLVRLADESAQSYFDYLLRLQQERKQQLDYGERPIEFIKAQIKHPRLRKLYEKRRAAEMLLEMFRVAWRTENAQ